MISHYRIKHAANVMYKFNYLSTLGRHLREISITKWRLWSLSSLPNDVSRYHWNPLLHTRHHGLFAGTISTTKSFTKQITKNMQWKYHINIKFL